MVTREKFEEFLVLLARLRETVAESGALVLVEGERDRRALSQIGLPRESLLVLNEGHPLSEVADRLVARGRPVILLTDWDAKGTHLLRSLLRLLQGSRVTVDSETRRQLGRVVRGDLLSVEALSGWTTRHCETFRLPLPEEALGAPRPTTG